MFNFLKKKTVTEVEIKAIADGKVIPIEKVPDNMFAQKLLGDGVGFVFDEDRIFAPCNCEITMVADTLHAFGLKAENGAEFLLHVGLDTVNLNGKGLCTKVKAGNKVKAGQVLLEIDRTFMDENHVELSTPLILTNADEYTMEKVKKEGSVAKEDTVLVIRKN